MDVCSSGVDNFGAEFSYYDDEAFDHIQLWNSSPVLLQMQLDELNMIMESMDSPYQIPNQSPLPFSNKTDTADSRSSSSSSASSLPSSSSTMTSRTNQSGDQSARISHGHAFQPYRCMISAAMESREEKTAVSQNMMKKAHSMLRNVNLWKEERKTEEFRPAVNQKQHMASERRRRERLNAGYHSLRKLLPPGSKKDKTSVLRKTMSCIKTLKTEVHELQEENRIIQQHFPSGAAAAQEHYYIFPGEKVEVQIINRSEEASETDLIDLVVMVRVPCDLVRVVLRVLECIRQRRDLSLLWLDSGTSYTHDQMISMSATLKLAIQGSTWNERTFKELITGAALMALNA